MSRRGLIAAISGAGAAALWSLSTIITGIVAILRDSKYLNDVMIPSLLIAAVIGFFSLRLTRRWWRQLSVPTPE
jgi:hypothetical protein